MGPRPKGVRIAEKEAPQKEVGRKKRVREDDGFAFTCAVCNDFGELLCCERCRDGFHLFCLGFNELPDIDPWLCSNCSDNKVRCFKCKAFGSLEVNLVNCTHRNCGKFYHKDCIKEWIRIPTKKTSATVSFLCPRHHCNTCRQFRKNAKLYRCLHCPVAYHESCSPEGTNLLENIPGYLLCWKHDEEWKNEHKDTEPTSDPKLFPERLPLPNVAHDFQLPRVIFDSVRRMPKKPPPYSHIRRNNYLIKRPKRSQKDDKMAQCLCKPTKGSKETCSEDCICGMLFTRCSSSCGCGDLCTNLPFQKLPGCKLKVVQTDRCGWGLVADEDIKAGSFLIEYVGDVRTKGYPHDLDARVIDDRTCEERLLEMKKQRKMSFYMCELSREVVIDATFKGNLSRYINHSCHPNSELQKWDVDGETRVGVFAIDDIKSGDSVTYDYKFIQFGTEQSCYCGAPNCRGQLGKPMKQKKASEASLSGCSLPHTLKMSNLCGNFSLKQAPVSVTQSTSHDASEGAVTQVTLADNRPEQSRGAKLVGLHIKIWWPLDQKFYPAKVLSFNGNSGKHQIRYDDGETEALCLFKERWEMGNVDKFKKRTRRDSSSTLDSPSVLEDASEKAVDSSLVQQRFVRTYSRLVWRNDH